MKPILILLSALALALTVVPSMLVFAGSLSWSAHATLMLAGTLLWFVTAPFWMEAKSRAPNRKAPRPSATRFKPRT